MGNGIAESLAKEIQDGTYVPSELANCQPTLPVDRNPHVVRFNQFILFAAPNTDVSSPQEPEYLILNQQPSIPPTPRGPGGPRIDIQQSVIAPLANRLISNLGNGPEKTKSAKLAAILEPLKRAGFSVRKAMKADINDRSHLTAALNDMLSNILLPDVYQPFQTPFLQFALCATYEQVWEPKGYTRGELITSISLAPGEQLTLDIHSWDKSTNKSEEELTTESELRSSENLTQRDVHTVTRETSSELKGDLSASGVQIPGIPATLGGNVSSTISQHTQNTTENIRERTIQASHTLKNTRKLRIEVSREVGREERQTRVVSNTNRCHTLNCHYFEIMANYLVTTTRVSLEPCLLLPFPKMNISSNWVLCYENTLKQSLLDKTFLDGFDGARVLETSKEFEEIVKEKEDADVQQYVDAILLAYNNLRGAVEVFKEQSDDQLTCEAASVLGQRGVSVAITTNITQDQLREVLYMGMLATDILAWNALKKFAEEASPSSSLHLDHIPPPPHGRHAIDALKDFLAVVDFNHYRPHLNASFSTGLSVLGISPNDMNSILAHGFFPFFGPYDAELFVATRAAYKKLKGMEKSADDQSMASDQGFPAADLAKARVSFDALKCHIEDNWIYYSQAIWMREGSDQRFLRLQSYGAISAFLENNMMGFLGHKAAFLLTDTNVVKPQIDFDAIKGAVPPLPPEVTAPQLITVPTHGTLLEAIVGECDSCEDFIQQSRVIDLRMQTAKAKQQEEEATRLKMRLDAQPPDLSAPQTPMTGRVVVTVDGDTAPPSSPSP